MKKVKKAKKKQRKISIHGWIIFIILLATVLVSAYIYTNLPNELDKISEDYISTLKRSVVQEKVQTSFDETYEASDYLFYGETLSLFGEAYGESELDSFLGKAIQLENIETGTQYSFTLSGKGDAGISLGQLEEGVYDIFIYDQYTKKRVYFPAPLKSKTLVTMRRNGTVKNITLEAGKDLFKDFNVELDKDYAYIVVKDSIAQKDIIDVLIDPSGNVLNELTNDVDQGVSNNKIVEKDSSYQLAQELKTELEKYGLKVQLSRNESDAVGYYGKDGRVGQGYEQQAKVFINLEMCDDSNITRPFFRVSPLTNASLANQITYYFNQDGLELDYPYSSSDLLESGVIFDTYIVDNDYNVTHFSLYPALRESGGKATFTGQLNDLGNQDYKNAFGMNTISFVYANIENADSINYYQEHESQIVKALAQGIASYYQLEVIEDETAAQ